MHNEIAGAAAAGFVEGERKVIVAASLGALFEWYEFFLYGTLAAVMAANFFSGLNPTSGFIFALLAFAAGFIVRPIGALFFGRIGDLVGRKYTFMVTLVVMGGATICIGLLPNYENIGIAAPIVLVAMRMLQGLAMGGEYGAAATYVAEHSPIARRGEYTAYIQLTAIGGILLSLLVVVLTRQFTGPDFDVWGWRIPFLFSAVLLVISVIVRSSMRESPIFKKMKNEGRTSKAPLKEAFGQWKNAKLVLGALFGLLAGQAVVWFTAIFYTMFFLSQTLKVDPATTNALMALALVITAPVYILMGRVSDKIGRKRVILGGTLLGALAIFPVFHALTYYANPALNHAQNTAPIVVTLNKSDCSFQFNPTGAGSFKTSCDVARRVLAANAASYSTTDDSNAQLAVIQIADTSIEAPNLDGLSAPDAKTAEQAFKAKVSAALAGAGYPAKIDPEKINKPVVVALLIAIMFFAATGLAPMASIMVEMFPTRIRYTAMSLPYHLGYGWFGGLLPTICFALVAEKGNIYAGLWYPVIAALISFVIGVIFVKDNHQRDLSSDD